jgi:hypothetical protein
MSEGGSNPPALFISIKMGVFTINKLDKLETVVMVYSALLPFVIPALLLLR